MAVGDWMVVSTMVGYQQTQGSDLAAAGEEVDATRCIWCGAGWRWSGPTTNAVG